MNNEPTVNGIFRQYGEAFRRTHPFLSRHERAIMGAIELCRTEALGGRIEVCDTCGHQVKIYHSCRNRHCPQCQFLKREQWIAEKKKSVFPFQYFHVVFTLPHQLITLIPGNRKLLYDLLFRSVKKTLLGVADEKKYFGARIGFFSILHTWGQKLNLHPHLHCAVPGGGLAGKHWIRSPRNYLLPVPVLKKRFRSLFLTGLKNLHNCGALCLTGTGFGEGRAFQSLIDTLFETDWVVYVKESFRNSDSVIEYLSRYTHRIAISNRRIIKVENDQVVFSYRDYAENNARKELSLPVEAFIRRMLLHVVPPRYVRIRYYGLMSNRNRKHSLSLCRNFFFLPDKASGSDASHEESLDQTFKDRNCCPWCGKGLMRVLNLPALERNHSPPDARNAG